MSKRQAKPGDIQADSPTPHAQLEKFDSDMPAYTVTSYIRDHLFSVALVILCLFVISVMLRILGITISGVIAIISIVAGCTLLIAAIDYCRKVAFYRELENAVTHLSAASYLTSLVSEPAFLDGRIAYGAATIVSKKANTEQESIVEQTSAYREYIEAWIHEIKTPLAAIKLILAHSHDSQAAKIAREVERIELQVDQALYYARSAAASKDYAIREVNLLAICQEACKRNARLLIEQGVSLNFKLDEKLSVLTDEAWSVFIISQFVVNAAKYGATTLTFSAEIYDANTPNGRTVLQVADNGCGIPAADMPRIFERGYIGQVGRKQGSATGMGLYLVAKLCESLGLDITFASEEGTGTRALLSFPHDRLRLLTHLPNTIVR